MVAKTCAFAALFRYDLVPSKEIRRMCAELRNHRNDVRRQLEGLEDLRGRLLRVLVSDWLRNASPPLTIYVLASWSPWIFLRVRL